MKFEIPSFYFDILEERHGEDKVAYAPIRTTGEYVEILDLVYSRTNKKEYYILDYETNDPYKWNEIKENIEKKTKTYDFKVDQSPLKHNYLFGIKETEILQEKTNLCKIKLHNIKESNYDLAILLKNVKSLFSENEKSYMEWYEEELDLNASKVSRLLKKLSLYETFLDYKQLINEISYRGIMALTKKKMSFKTQSIILEKINDFKEETGEIMSGLKIEELVDNLLGNLKEEEDKNKKAREIGVREVNDLIGRYFEELEELDEKEKIKITNYLDSIYKVLEDSKKKRGEFSKAVLK